MRNQNLRGGQDSLFTTNRHLNPRRIVNSEPRRGFIPTRAEHRRWHDTGKQRLKARRQHEDHLYYQRMMRDMERDMHRHFHRF